MSATWRTRKRRPSSSRRSAQAGTARCGCAHAGRASRPIRAERARTANPSRSGSVHAAAAPLPSTDPHLAEGDGLAVPCRHHVELLSPGRRLASAAKPARRLSTLRSHLLSPSALKGHQSAAVLDFLCDGGRDQILGTRSAAEPRNRSVPRTSRHSQRWIAHSPSHVRREVQERGPTWLLGVAAGGFALTIILSLLCYVVVLTFVSSSDEVPDTYRSEKVRLLAAAALTYACLAFASALTALAIYAIVAVT